jgi:hypothetical protein
MNHLTHVYIASLGHSGSTILTIALGSAPGGISLGEVESTIRQIDREQHTCTCGADAETCPVWGPVFGEAELRASKDLSRGYATLHAGLLQRDDVHLAVDSSKHLRALESIEQSDRITVKVIFLVKDPRSYFVSHYRKWISSAGADAAARGKRRARTFPAELAVALGSWWYGNRKILRTLRTGGYDYIVLSYEDMVLDTERAEQRVSEFLGVPVSLSDYTVREEQQHILRGNALRHDPTRSSSLRYDYRWFYDPWVRRLGLPFRFLLRWGAGNGLLGGGES